MDSSDVLEIQAQAGEAFQYVRKQTAPAALVLHTYRFSAHSKGDDPRDRATIASIRERFDPLTIHAARLQPSELEQAEAHISGLVDSAFTRAYADPFPQFVETSAHGDR